MKIWRMSCRVGLCVVAEGINKWIVLTKEIVENHELSVVGELLEWSSSNTHIHKRCDDHRGRIWSNIEIRWWNVIDLIQGSSSYISPHCELMRNQIQNRTIPNTLLHSCDLVTLSTFLLHENSLVKFPFSLLFFSTFANTLFQFTRLCLTHHKKKLQITRT